MDDILKLFASRRLKPNHIVSQWYMYLDDIQKQVEFLYNSLECEKLMFLGDGDGISIMLALTLAKNKSKKLKQIFVFDIDERELNLYKNLAKENGVSEYVDFQTIRYNIFDKVPSKFLNKFDAFYINPPYSSTTQPKGLGFLLWLERCIEMTKRDAKGYIVYPTKDNDQIAINEIGKTIFQYLEENHFNVLQNPAPISHRYEETDCISENLIVEKTKNTSAHYKGKKIPFEIANSLYHNKLLPHYILDDGTTYGSPVDF